MNASSDAGPDAAAGQTAVSADTGRPATRRWWVVGMLLVAASMRCWNLKAVGLRHFDEGVYAFSGMWVLGVPFYTGQHYYAPPLLPGAIGVAYWLQGGVSDLAAIAVSLAAGTVTVFLVWRVGSRWYGPAAGLAAGCLAALSEMHISYSRMALTDVLLTMWLVAALGCLREALKHGSFRWAVAAGLATALAWNTKYNGWLPLAIGLVPVAWSSARSAGRRTPLPCRAMSCWLLAAGIALAGYLPWVWYVQQQPGGYVGLVKHHRGYVVGWSGWVGSFAQQADNLVQRDGIVSHLAVPLAVIAVCCCGTVPWRRHWGAVALLATALLGFALPSTAISVHLALAGLAALMWWVSGLRRWRLTLQQREPLDASAGLHGAWLLVLLLLTPFYYPYARLVLPWLPAVWLAAGAAIARVLVPGVVGSGPTNGGRRGGAGLGETRLRVGSGPANAGSSSPSRLVRWLLAAVTAAAVGSLVVRLPPRPTGLAWRGSDQYRAAARAIAGEVPADAEVLVYAEPPLLFYLVVGGEGAPGRPAQPLASLTSLEQWVVQPGTRSYLVLGPQYYTGAGRGESLRGVVQERLRFVASISLDAPGANPVGRKVSPEEADAADWRFDLFEVLPRER